MRFLNKIEEKSPKIIDSSRGIHQTLNSALMRTTYSNNSLKMASAKLHPTRNVPFLLVCLICCSVSALANEDDTIKTMEAFSGYPIHETTNPFGSSSLISSLSVDGESLQRQIDELSTFSDTPAPSVTRVLYTGKDVSARRYIKNLMGLSGLSVREDAVGNIFGRWNGNQPGLPAVATGSHIDAIPYSGKYDGVVGVLGAIEAINVLKRSGFQPKRSLEVILFTSEEPTRFGISCLGSRLMAGSNALAEALKTAVDGQNISFVDAARSAGYMKDGDDLSSVFLDNGNYSAFLELHIEQGPILEAEGLSIGIVTAIAAPASIKVDFEGNGGHAGAVLMPNRNDAGLAAAELALAVEKHVLDSGSIDTVGTVVQWFIGILELHPGAINSIPSKSHLEIDKSVITAMEDASKELNLTHKLMISRAYHDSLFMARVSPMGMLFIPCFKGYSHKPEEYASSEDIANGVKVLALTMAKLSLH
ncbi:Ureidoglycolate hydrolase [Linum perenne]